MGSPDFNERHAAVMAEAAERPNANLSRVIAERASRPCPACTIVIARHDGYHPAGTGCGCLDALDELHDEKHLEELELRYLHGDR